MYMICTFSAFILTTFSHYSLHHQAEKAKTKDDSDNNDDIHIKPVTEDDGNNNNITSSPTPAPTINEPDPDDEGVEFEHFTAYSSSQESPH